MDKKTLYHKGKNGELRVWSVWTEKELIKVEYGVLNGEMQITVRKATPKNVGKKNETTAEQQAEAEAQSLYQFKLDRKYSTTQESAQEPLLLPMLAKDDLKKIKFPCYVQPKLDGVRCLAFWEGDKIKLISRAGKEWTVPKHINEQLTKALPKDSMFDGELYIHGKSCQKITSYVKKWREVETPLIEYHIYDAPIYGGIDDYPCETRLGTLSFIDRETGHPCSGVTEIDEDWERMIQSIPNLIRVETGVVNSLEELKQYESLMVSQGYEGAIARNADGLYLFGYRSNDLIKVKTFQDAEFKVIDVVDGVGKFEGKACFICENDLNNLTFECTMATTMEEKAKQFLRKEEYIGRKLTVKFFNRTDDNLPRFPVGKLFRDEIDLS